MGSQSVGGVQVIKLQQQKVTYCIWRSNPGCRNVISTSYPTACRWGNAAWSSFLRIVSKGWWLVSVHRWNQGTSWLQRLVGDLPKTTFGIQNTKKKKPLTTGRSAMICSVDFRGRCGLRNALFSCTRSVQICRSIFLFDCNHGGHQFCDYIFWWYDKQWGGMVV